MRFLHGTLEFLRLLLRHASDVDAVYLDLLVLIDVDVKEHTVFSRNVIALVDGDLRVFEALLFEVAFDMNLGTVDDVGVDIATHLKSEALFDFLTLRLLHATIIDARHLRQSLQIDVQINLAAHNTVGFYTNVREALLLHVSAYGFADVLARHVVHLSHGESGDARQDIFIVILVSFNHKSAQNITGMVLRV